MLNIKPDDIEFYFVSLNEIKLVKTEWECLNNALLIILKEIMDKEIPFIITEDDKPCRFCDYIYFCGKKKEY